MDLWNTIKMVSSLVIFGVFVYLCIMAAHLPKPKYIYDEDEKDETN